MFIASLILISIGTLGTTMGMIFLVGWIVKKLTEVGD